MLFDLTRYSRAELKHETRQLLALAIPMMLGQIATVAIGVADTAMSGAAGKDDLTAVALGNSAFSTLFITFMGIMAALNPIIAQQHGAGGTHEVGETGRQGLWFGLLLGIIAITLALEAPDTEVHAVERSPDALAVAQQNAKALRADNIHWHAGSWWQALASRRRFDLIVSNPPYIAANDHHLQQGDLRFEPPQALAAGPDGLDDLRIIIGGAPTHLNPGGWLLLEHGYDQEAPVQALLRDAGFADVFTRRDLAGQPRVSGGQWLGDGRK